MSFDFNDTAKHTDDSRKEIIRAGKKRQKIKRQKEKRPEKVLLLNKRYSQRETAEILGLHPNTINNMVNINMTLKADTRGKVLGRDIANLLKERVETFRDQNKCKFGISIEDEENINAIKNKTQDNAFYSLFDEISNSDIIRDKQDEPQPEVTESQKSFLAMFNR